MERLSIIQPVLDLFGQARYLEIGVSHGITFQAARAAEKVAVDLQYSFDYKAAAAAADSRYVRYHEVASDDYFARIKAPTTKFDVVYIDGLHTFDQTLRDLLNAVACLEDGGVIIIDDILPTSYAASLRDFAQRDAYLAQMGEREDAWMGDVYRLVFFVRDYLPAFEYATVAESHGVLVMWKSWPAARPGTPKTVEAVARLDYVTAMIEMPCFQKRPLAEIVTAIAAWRKSR